MAMEKSKKSPAGSRQKAPAAGEPKPWQRRRWFLIALLCIPFLIIGILALPMLFKEHKLNTSEVIRDREKLLGKNVVVEGYVIIDAHLSGTDMGLLQLYGPEHIDVVFEQPLSGSYIVGDKAKVKGRLMSASELFDYVKERYGLSPQEVRLDFALSDEEKKVRELIHVTPPDEFLDGVTPQVIWAEEVSWVKE
jgi:hypothetical protein